MSLANFGGKTAGLALVDITDKTVATQVIIVGAATSATVATKGLHPGIYLLHATGAAQNLQTQVVVQ